MAKMLPNSKWWITRPGGQSPTHTHNSTDMVSEASHIHRTLIISEHKLINKTTPPNESWFIFHPLSWVSARVSCGTHTPTDSYKLSSHIRGEPIRAETTYNFCSHVTHTHIAGVLHMSFVCAECVLTRNGFSSVGKKYTYKRTTKHTIHKLLRISQFSKCHIVDAYRRRQTRACVT